MLSNLFLHYVFDVWLKRGFPGVPFERYADDIICHCRSEHEAAKLREVLKSRSLECSLELHAEKSKVAYCKDTNRKGIYAIQQFDFLGYCFRPRKAKWPSGGYGTSFLPVASPKALKAIRKKVRDWTLQNRSDKALDDLARMFNPYIRGWINYYSHFYQSAFYPTLRRIDAALARWTQKKFKRLRQKPKGARGWITKVAHTSTGLFAIGRFCMVDARRWEPYESRGSRTVLGERGVRFPRATHWPLYRRSEIYAREDVDLDRSTLAGWVGATGDLLAPFVDAVRKHVLAGSKLHADDTPVPVLQTPKAVNGCECLLRHSWARPIR